MWLPVPEVLAETSEHKSMTADVSWADMNLDITERSRLIEIIENSKRRAP